MKLYRFMSFKEFNDLTFGMNMVSHNSHAKCRTNSVGFCFLGEQTDVMGRALTPVQCFQFLRGIVSDEILVEFEAPSNAVRASYGVYANPFSDDFVVVDEYCTEHYNHKVFRPLRYCMFDRQGHEDWYTCNYVGMH